MTDSVDKGDELIMGRQLFREKSLEKNASPDQLKDYIRVPAPGIWMVLTAVILLAAGIGIWGFFIYFR